MLYSARGFARHFVLKRGLKSFLKKMKLCRFLLTQISRQKGEHQLNKDVIIE